MEKINVKSDNEFSSFFGGQDDIIIVDDDIETKEEDGEEEKEEEKEDDDSEVIVLDEGIKDSKSIKKVEEEEEEKVDVSLYKGVAKTFAEKFGLDFNEDSISSLDDLAEFADAFSDYVAEAKIESYKNTNEELNMLINIAERGGNLKELSKLYTERQEILEHDISSESGQVDIIKQYYKSIGKTDEWVKKHISRLKSDDELVDEAEEVKETFQLKKKEEADKKAILEQKEIKKREDEKIFKINMLGNSFIKNGLSQKAAASAVDYVYKEAYKAKDGTLLTEFDKKIIDVKNDPDELLELIQFLNNKEKYIQLKTSKEITKKTETTFANILKNNVNKKVGGFQDVKEPPLKTKALTLNDYLK